MKISILSHKAMQITSEDDVVLVRREVRALAQGQGFDSFATAAVTTATSELTRNVFVHARSGEVDIDVVSDGRRNGLRITFRDKGPGIADVDRAMRGGYSTARSLGLGLSGSKRLVDEFMLDSVVGAGTTVTFVKWKPF
ncbi:MAG TPA: anti-sigma regulatory factor [Polyangiaceae bacterium]|nr:anti-sigma regulatory factor [Polyangiaceae bacterium]